MQQQQKIPLDRPTLKALAGDTRIKILKLLDKKALTQSDLAQELKMKLPTVGEHLRSLEHAELVDREKTERKWKYYSLTNKARILLHPHTGALWFIFGVFILGAAATVATAVSYFSGLAPYASKARAMEAEAAPVAEALAADAAVETVGKDPTLMMLIMLCVFTIIVLVLLISLLKRHGWLGKSLPKK